MRKPAPKRASRAAARPAAKAARARRSRSPIAGPVKILFLDADGTLTDGVIAFDRDGDQRNFWVRDGIALEWARARGVLPVVISGRASAAVEQRMKDLKLEAYLGAKDKVSVAERVLAREGVAWNECAMVGDDLPDVPMLRRVGWPIVVANSSPEILRFGRTVTRRAGGFGAVREAVELILRHNGTWDDVLRQYEALG